MGFVSTKISTLFRSVFFLCLICCVFQSLLLRLPSMFCRASFFLKILAVNTCLAVFFFVIITCSNLLSLPYTILCCIGFVCFQQSGVLTFLLFLKEFHFSFLYLTYMCLWVRAHVSELNVKMEVATFLFYSEFSFHCI